MPRIDRELVEQRGRAAGYFGLGEESCSHETADTKSIWMRGFEQGRRWAQLDRRNRGQGGGE